MDESNNELIDQIDVLNDFIKSFHEKKMELYNEFVKIYENSNLLYNEKCFEYRSRYGVIQQLLSSSIERFVVAKHKLLDSQ